MRGADFFKKQEFPPLTRKDKERILRDKEADYRDSLVKSFINRWEEGGPDELNIARTSLKKVKKEYDVLEREAHRLKSELDKITKATAKALAKAQKEYETLESSSRADMDKITETLKLVRTTAASMEMPRPEITSASRVTVYKTFSATGRTQPVHLGKFIDRLNELFIYSNKEDIFYEK